MREIYHKEKKNEKKLQKGEEVKREEEDTERGKINYGKTKTRMKKRGRERKRGNKREPSDGNLSQKIIKKS